MNAIVDYLGMFEVEAGMSDAADVMRDLLRKGLQAELFVPRAELLFTEEEVSLSDTNSPGKPEVWAYFTNSVRDPVAFVNNKQDSGFSRVLIFTVLGVGHFNRNPVMFAFQCVNCEPQMLVERILELTGDTLGPPPPSNGSATFASVHRRASSTASSMFGSVSSPREGNARKPLAFPSPRVPEVAARTEESLGFDKPSFVFDHSEDPIQKDTILLNYCIDDIEAKCRKLRESRAQVSEGGLGALEDYQATDFISIFQKVKLALNLLGRLNTHIRDPNAADLVHHLFPPLAFLMDACLDLFDEDVQREVASPFMTQQSITLLQNCLSSREIKIWEACGDYWRLPWSELSGAPRIPYKPVFLDGWSPGYVTFVEENQVALPSAAAQKAVSRQASTSSSRQRTPAAAQHRGSRGAAPIQNKSDTESDYGSDGSVYNVGKYSSRRGRSVSGQTEQEEWRDGLMAKGADIALVTYTREGHNQRELSVMKGDYLEVLNSEKKWWKARSSEAEVGFVPYTILKSLVYRDAPTYWEDAERERKSSQKRRSPPPAPRPASPPRSASPAPSVVPPPPPQPTWTTETPTVVRRAPKKTERSDSTATSMAEELRHVLSFYSEDKAKHLEIQKTPDIFIDQRSTAREVKEWLQAKQFSSRVLKQMEGHNGRQVLGLQREALEAAFGKEEGGRLDSQIILSRNQTKYTQGRNSELRAILDKARRRSEKKKREEEEQQVDQLDDSKV